MEEIRRAAVVYNLRIFLNGIDAKIDELMSIREKDGSGGLLIITAITRIEDFNPDLALLVWLFGCDGEAA